ncbi:MAG: tetratricopeptide repeat protein [Myxacorys chilensis ATA2-1-KO14]|jgi:curved DNA-binding protein CbpA|nr:tetratricopeptide repeat protein [Myxacorys chilensis ATA2-1-KO14]
MSFQINRGLFTLDMSDYHAILGVSVESDVKDIRKNYLKIARRLHPDSCTADTEHAKQLAAQLLSKLVNPAWEKLSQEKNRTEHELLLKLKGQAAARKRHEIELMSSVAQQMLKAGNPDQFYRSALQDLAERQFQHLDQVPEMVAQLSELNMAYLMRRTGLDETTSGTKTTYTGASATSSPTSSPTGASTGASTTVVPAKPSESVADQYYRRAENFMAKGNFAQATLELRDALKLEPNNSRCHSLMGMVYLRQNQATMAKIHFNKALALNPDDPIAIEGKQKVDPAPSTSQSAAKPGKNDRNLKSNSGLFSSLFSGKKK